MSAVSKPRLWGSPAERKEYWRQDATRTKREQLAQSNRASAARNAANQRDARASRTQSRASEVRSGTWWRWIGSVR